MNYDTMVDAITNNKLQKAVDEIEKETPPPMNTMLEKQSCHEAIEKKNTRQSMVITDVPPTNPGRLFCQIIYHLVLVCLD